MALKEEETNITFVVPKVISERLRQEAQRQSGRSLSSLMREIVTQYIQGLDTRPNQPAGNK